MFAQSSASKARALVLPYSAKISMSTVILSLYLFVTKFTLVSSMSENGRLLSTHVLLLNYAQGPIELRYFWLDSPILARRPMFILYLLNLSSLADL